MFYGVLSTAHPSLSFIEKERHIVSSLDVKVNSSYHRIAQFPRSILIIAGGIFLGLVNSARSTSQGKSAKCAHDPVQIVKSMAWQSKLFT